MRALTRELILRGAITTTVAKAKEMRPFVERLITHAKKQTVASRRHLASQLGGSESVVKKIVDEVAPQYKERPGGYTRIIKLGRTGKRAAEHAKIELV